MLDEYVNQLDESETDFIEKYKQAAQVKMKAYAKNPHILNFMGALALGVGGELSTELKARLEEARNRGIVKLFKNIDTSRFRENVPPEQIIKLIRWSMDGYTEELMAGIKGRKLSSFDFDPYWKEFYDFLAVLKKVFYKQGG